MERLLARLFRFTERDRADGFADHVTARHVFGRMEIAQARVLPWIAAAIPDLARRAVLEIGCGTGSATVPLALACRHVHAFDTTVSHVEVARERCALLGIANVSLSVEAPDWTARYVTEPIAPADGRPSRRRRDANRLYPFDWHSSQLPFMDQVPDEIAYLWNAFSARRDAHPDIVAATREAAANGNRERLYRFGRGLSFHEFHDALGADAYRVVASLDRMDMAGADADYVATLRRQLADVTPPVHPAFAFPSLDLVIEKTGPARLG